MGSKVAEVVATWLVGRTATSRPTGVSLWLGALESVLKAEIGLWSPLKSMGASQLP